ncbi:hypothetical protein N7517_005472 [Penicillium concentricum]|uniref:Uncharacterized protein n=1 Tax=Penicillium concentricum TaxID=293559 RepID=A0A9W9VBM3_9EURO|nr:uncharacterized protein N7517_005472 [Penicillium concentricum]KAJ5373466.1 hypothetical protein N7517_005472 [Penicillium concentricum]
MQPGEQAIDDIINPKDATARAWTFLFGLARPINARLKSIHVYPRQSTSTPCFNFTNPEDLSRVGCLAHASDKVPGMACPPEALIAISIAELGFKN